MTETNWRRPPRQEIQEGVEAMGRPDMEESPAESGVASEPVASGVAPAHWEGDADNTGPVPECASAARNSDEEASVAEKPRGDEKRAAVAATGPIRRVTGADIPPDQTSASVTAPHAVAPPAAGAHPGYRTASRHAGRAYHGGHLGQPAVGPAMGAVSRVSPPFGGSMPQGQRFAQPSPPQHGPRPPGAAGPGAPAPAQQEARGAPSRKGDRKAEVVAFVLHQFPIGHLPVAASEASQQLPRPEADDDQPAGLRFAPQDHPNSPLVNDREAVHRARMGGALPSAPERNTTVPVELATDHDPLAELSDLEWERKYLVRLGSGSQRDEYAWPPPELAPEGGVDTPAAEVLEPDTVLDRIGDGYGRVLAADGTAFPQRSLPPGHWHREYHRYRVMRPLPVWHAAAAPWFAQTGGGTRYRTTYPIVDLIALGYLVELVPENEDAEARTLRLRADSSEEAESQGSARDEGPCADEGSEAASTQDPDVTSVTHDPDVTSAESNPAQEA